MEKISYLYLIALPTILTICCMCSVNAAENGFISSLKLSKLFDSGGGIGNHKSWTASKEAFIHDINSISKEFSSQNRETWLQIRSTIGKTLEPNEPKYPAVITALVPPSVTDDFSVCFVRKVIFALNKAVAPILENTKGISPLVITPFNFTQKSITNIRADIENYLKTSGKGIIVLDIDKFEKEHDLLMFHGMCDNYHAVDVRATMIFPVRVPQSIFQKYSSWSHIDGGKISNDVLTAAWEDTVGDNVGPALIARVADAVILLNEGDDCVDNREIYELPQYITEERQPLPDGTTDESLFPIVIDMLNQIRTEFKHQTSELVQKLEAKDFEINEKLNSLSNKVDVMQRRQRELQRQMDSLSEVMNKWWWSILWTSIQTGEEPGLIAISVVLVTAVTILIVCTINYYNGNATQPKPDIQKPSEPNQDTSDGRGGDNSGSHGNVNNTEASVVPSKTATKKTETYTQVSQHQKPEESGEGNAIHTSKEQSSRVTRGQSALILKT